MNERYKQMWHIYKLQISELAEKDCELINNSTLDVYTKNRNTKEVYDKMLYKFDKHDKSIDLISRKKLEKSVDEARLYINALIIIDSIDGTQTTNNLSSFYPEAFEIIGVSESAFGINKAPIYKLMQIISYQEKWLKLKNIYQEALEMYAIKNIQNEMKDTQRNYETLDERFLQEQLKKMNNIELKYL